MSRDLDVIAPWNAKDVAESLIEDFGTTVDVLSIRTRSVHYGVDPERVATLIGLATVRVTWDE